MAGLLFRRVRTGAGKGGTVPFPCAWFPDSLALEALNDHRGSNLLHLHCQSFLKNPSLRRSELLTPFEFLEKAALLDLLNRPVIDEIFGPRAGCFRIARR